MRMDRRKNLQAILVALRSRFDGRIERFPVITRTTFYRVRAGTMEKKRLDEKDVGHLVSCGDVIKRPILGVDVRCQN